MRRTIILALAFIWMARAGYAKPPATSFVELRHQVSVGDKLLVTNDAGKVVKGTVEEVSDTDLVLRSADESFTFTAENVRRVARRGHMVRNGALLGVAAGFTAGTLWASQQPCDFTCFSSTGGVLLSGGIAGAIGLAGGAGIGAALNRDQVIFERAPTARASARISLLFPRTKGVLVQIDW